MLSLIKKFRGSHPKTKMFVLTLVFWTAAVILPAIFCFARMDFVRSYNKAFLASEQNLEKE